MKWTLILTLLPIITLANEPDKNIPLFQDNKPIELVLEMDMQKVLNDRSENPEYLPALLVHRKSETQIRAFNIKIKARGRTRRITEVCEFPPLKLNFEKKSTKNTVFEGQDKIKMVTHCRNEEGFQNFSMLEYFTYKTFNQLTDNSYKVRLVNVIYRDTKQKYADIQKSGFFIEDDEMMAERIGGALSDKKIWSSDSCDQKAVNILALFQFMIGNTDWWIHTRHNVDIVATDNEVLIPVPFDFDYAGIINTPYAVPSSQMPIRHVKDRFLKASCKTMDDYSAEINHFNQQREHIYLTLADLNTLDKKHKKIATKYLDEFFKIINDPEKFNKFLDATCYYVNNPPNKVRVRR